MTAGGGIEVHRGPLLYALRPASVVTSAAWSGGKADQPYPGSLPAAGAGWPLVATRQITIAANASWNYGLDPESLRCPLIGVT